MKITLPLKKLDGSILEERTCEFNSLRVGTIKRIFRVIDIDRLMKECKTSKDVVDYLIGRSIGMFPVIEDIVKEMFGLTEMEFEENVEAVDLVGVVHIIIFESVKKLEGTEEGLKNLLRAAQ